MSSADELKAAREAVLERLRADARFLLAAHENPDGDALGSLVAMAGLLEALGKDAMLFMEQSDLPLPHEYRFLELRRLVHEAPEDIAERTVILLDCGNIDRSSAGLLEQGAHLLNIDHHHDNTRFGTLDYVVPSASSTAEIVWELMGDLGVRPTPDVAQALYVGLVTDTGRFMYENTGPRAHQMAASLLELGLDVQAIYKRLFEEVPMAKLVLLGRALEHVRRYDGGELTLATLSAEDFAAAGAQESHSEGIVDHLRAVEGTKVAVLARELTAPESRGKRKVSLRATDDDADVSAIARTQGGGGHRRAAGFSTTLELDDLIALLRGQIAAQLHPALNGRAAAGADFEPGAARDRGRPRGGQVPGGHVSRRRSGDQARARRGQDRARWHSGPVRDRAAADPAGPGDQAPEQADGAAQALRGDRAPGSDLEHGRPRGGDRRDLVLSAGSPHASHGCALAAPPAVLRGQDRWRARLPARPPWGALSDTRAHCLRSSLRAALAGA